MSVDKLRMTWGAWLHSLMHWPIHTLRHHKGPLGF